MGKINAWLDVRTETTRRDRLVPYAVLGVTVLATVTLGWLQRNNSANDAARDSHRTAVDVARVEYSNQLGDYKSCLIRYDSRSALRSSGDNIYEGIISVAERFGAPDLAQAFRERQAEFDAGFTVPDPAECIEPQVPLILLQEGIGAGDT